GHKLFDGSMGVDARNERAVRVFSGCKKLMMPKEVKSVWLAILGLIALFAGSLLSQPSSAQLAPQHPETAASARNAALMAATQDVLKETSEIRQLAILRPVQSSAQSRAEIERMIVKNLEEETTPAQIHATEVTLRTLGLVPQDFDFRSLMIRLLREQVAGYYDPKMRQFHLADW